MPIVNHTFPGHTTLLIGVLLLWSCADEPPARVIQSDVTPNASCVGYFGTPNENSGLNSDECNRNCLCENGAETMGTIPLQSPAFELLHLNPQRPLVQDPYETLLSPSQSDEVCEISIDTIAGTYELKTRPRLDTSPQTITHTGPCGACSSLQDLHVYAANTDLTEPVRQCGILGISQGKEENIECLKTIGFSDACATIWFYNTRHTRMACLDVCLSNFNSAYVNDAGQLNACLACDETQSGPIFKKFAGRTRRNSGLASAICRPCDTVSRIPHTYLLYQ